MAFRTYIPGLRLALGVIKRYANKWQTQLQGNLTEQQYLCLVAVITAVDECLGALGEAEILP